MKQKILQAKDVALMLGIRLERVEELRQRQELPFIRVDATHRVYFESDIIAWLQGRRVILGQ